MKKFLGFLKIFSCFLAIAPIYAQAQFYEDTGVNPIVMRQTFMAPHSTLITVSAPVSLSAFSLRVANDGASADTIGLKFFVYDNGVDNGDYSNAGDDPAGHILYMTTEKTFTSTGNLDFSWRESPDFSLPVNLIPGRKYLLGVIPNKNIITRHRLGPFTQANVTAQPQVRDGTPPGTTFYNTRRMELQLFAPTADVSISKSDGVTEVSPGSSVTYSITVNNAGPNGTRALVSDVLPAMLGNPVWTCTGSGGGNCSSSGSGNISDSVDLPVGGSVVYSLTAQLASSATGTLVNTATITPEAGVTDPNPSNNSATDTDTIKPNAIPPVASVPTLGVWGLISLSALLAVFGLVRSRRQLA